MIRSSVLALSRSLSLSSGLRDGSADFTGMAAPLKALELIHKKGVRKFYTMRMQKYGRQDVEDVEKLAERLYLDWHQTTPHETLGAM